MTGLLDLSGKTALVTGIANNRSIAWGIAQKLHQAGAKLGITYLPDDRDRNKGKVAELTDSLTPDFLLPCNVQDDAQIDSLFASVAEKWGKIDVLVHCLAFANKEDLSGNFTDISRSGFQLALDVSAYSLIHLCRAARPLLKDGGSVITLTYIGGAKVVPNYNVMGIAKAALEMNVRYLASDMGPDNIRINAISAGPIRTLASAAIGDFHKMLHHYEETAPLRRLVTPDDVGNVATFLGSDLSSAVTGQIIYVDAGYEVMGA